MKNRLLSLLLALIMCLGLAVPALAANEDFVIEDGVLMQYVGSGGDVTIPDGVTDIGMNSFIGSAVTSVTIPSSVTAIWAWAFDGCASLTSVTIPASVTEISPTAFWRTPWLKSLGEFAVVNGILFAYQGAGGDVTIPDGVTAISGGLFADGPTLTSITIPSGVTSIGGDAFRWTELTNVVLPDGVTTIGSHAFGETPITSVTIPASVTEIGWQAFWCDNLKDVYYGGSEAQWAAINIDWEGEDVHPEWGNECLRKATIHYNSQGSAAPSTPTTPVVTTPSTSFTDVAADAYYAAPVAWAIEKSITNGTTPTRFSPGENCTNAQILTFIWRAYGRPEPTVGNPFTNSIPEDYAKAAIWAFEKGMVSGTTFDVDKPCTRAMVAMYLWQAAGSPAPSAAASFTDVPTDASYALAVAWAVEKEITKGTNPEGTMYSPDEICDRGQIVTFLYRNLA